MPISAGDVVLTFTADMTQLDAAFNKVANETAAKLQPAVSAMGGLGQAAQTTGKVATDAGTSLADAWKLIGPLAQQSDSALQNMAFALTNVTVPAIKEGKKHLEDFGHGFALVNEFSRDAIGVSLPRHVKEFLKELPGVASALSSAFAVTAVLFIIEAIAKGIEKLIEWQQESHRIAVAQEEFKTAVLNSFHSLDEKLLQSGIKLDELRGDHVAALKKALELIDHQSFKELEGEFATLAKAADAVFKELEGHWFLLDFGAKGAQNALKDFRAQYDLFLAQGKDKDANDLLEGTLTSAKKTLGILQNSKKEADDVRQLGLETGRGASILGPSGATEKEIKAQESLIAVLEAQVAARKKVNDLTKDNKEIKTGEEAAKVADLQIAEAQRVEKAQLAEIELTKSRYQLYYEQRRIGAVTLAAVEVKSADDARKAHEAYLEKVISEYKKAGEGAKAKAAQEELATFKIKSAAQAVESLTKATHAAAEETKKFEKTSHETVIEMEKIGEVAITAPLSKFAKDALQLNEDLKKLGIQGWIPIRQQLAAATDAEKKLNAAGIHEGKLWLQVQAAKLKAIIAVAHAQGKAALDEEKALKKLEKEIRAYDGVVKGSKAEVAAAWTGEALAAAFAADSVGAAAQAILNSVLKNLSGMAFAKGTEQLAEGLARLNPIYALTHGPPGPHFASAAEWFALGGVAGIAGAALGGGGGGKSGSSSASSGPSVDSGSSANHPAQQPVSTTNIAHLGNGGLVSTEMIAAIGHGREIVLPLDNESVIQAFRERIGANGPITVIVEGIPLHKLSRKLSSDQKKGKYRVHSTSTARTIRQY